jgi:hypothetical protein
VGKSSLPGHIDNTRASAGMGCIGCRQSYAEGFQTASLCSISRTFVYAKQFERKSGLELRIIVQKQAVMQFRLLLDCLATDINVTAVVRKSNLLLLQDP